MSPRTVFRENLVLSQFFNFAVRATFPAHLIRFYFHSLYVLKAGHVRPLHTCLNNQAYQLVR
jgi:hypothetical protein